MKVPETPWNSFGILEYLIEFLLIKHSCFVFISIYSKFAMRLVNQNLNIWIHEGHAPGYSAMSVDDIIHY